MKASCERSTTSTAVSAFASRAAATTLVVNASIDSRSTRPAGMYVSLPSDFASVDEKAIHNPCAHVRRAPESGTQAAD